jgi:hypothetical protein
MVWAEQAIFTSLPRRGKAGYHLVAQSPGVSVAEANALTTWSPSHGGLIVDAANRTSVNFHPLPSGRYALSRTCEGLAEYSGRGGRQLYTHAVIVDEKQLRKSNNHPFDIYYDALALGHFRYRPDPESSLRPVPLSSLYVPRDDDYWTGRAESLGLGSLRELRERLTSHQTVVLEYTGDRMALAASLIGLVPPELRLHVSFATSLRPSMVRPFQLVLVDPAH